MHRKFEEIGFDVGGSTYGLFSGEAEWDAHGDVVAIELEATRVDVAPLKLDAGDLVRERIALRKHYGSAFLEETDRLVKLHARKWFLFQGLSDALQDVFAEDVQGEQEAIRADASARRSVGR